jgi:hypothetical protein
LLVDAYLLDRRTNVRIFGEAHRVGALLQQEFSCDWTLTEDEKYYENPCGVLALHSRVGLSPGGRSWGTCSICDADDFECDHVPGQMYGGDLCYRNIYRFDAEEVSFTTRPRDRRCFRVWVLVPRHEVGQRRPMCVHCQRCAGAAGPTPEDQDPGTWPSDVDALIEETVRRSRSALTIA